MKVLVETAQQTNVHFFKYVIWDLERRGHEICIVARDRELTLPLLDIYGFKYYNISKARRGRLGLFLEMLERDYRMYRIARHFRPDVLVGRTVCFTHVAKLIGAPAILDDDCGRAVGIIQRFKYPFADVICTPACLEDDLGPKQIRYEGYKELAYLHPNHYKPDPSVLSKLGLEEGEPFFVLRFTSMEALPDIGRPALSEELKRLLISELSQRGRVFVTSEGGLGPDLEPYRIPISPHRIHDVLYYAQMLVGDSGTMSSEAAVLGTPAVWIHHLADKLSTSLQELERRYGLLYAYTPDQEDKAYARVVELLNNAQLELEWQEKRCTMLRDKIDVVDFIVDLIQRYPQSFYEYE
jgi:predicted glycosyltransferase